MTTPNRYGYINPAASAYRKLFVERIGPAIDALQADALHLDIAGWPPNDGNGPIEGMNYNQGAAQLHRDLLAAFPNLVLGVEGTNDVIAPFHSFVQQIDWPAAFNSSDMPPVPITAYLLPNVQAYGHLAVPNPFEGGFLNFLRQYEGQAVLPTFATGFNTSSAPNYAQAEMARYLKVVSAFQQNQLQPHWDSDWAGAIMQYVGANGPAAITDDGKLLQFDVQQPDGTARIYQRVHGVNRIDSDRFIPNWPAYDGTTALGLDPEVHYWLDETPAEASPAQITSLPDGVKLGLGAGTLVTADFAHFQLQPLSAPSFDFFANLWLANGGTTYGGTDGPLMNGAFIQQITMVVGGDSRRSVYAPLPAMGRTGGETYFEYKVPVPAADAVRISFAAGIMDAAIGQRKGPMTFRVEVNGVVAWKQDVSTGAWQAGSADLSSFAGKTLRVRFVTNPGPANDSTFGWAGWSGLGLTVVGKAAPIEFSLTLRGDGEIATQNISGFPLGDTHVVFLTPPRAVQTGQSLVDIPFTKSQSSDGQVAGPSQVPGAGSILTTTAGGVARQRTLNSLAPTDGQTILSWSLELPESPALALAFGAAMWDQATPTPAGVMMSVCVNGTVLWEYNARLPAVWKDAMVDLTRWSGQKVVLELISDSLGPNHSHWTSWSGLTVGAVN